jgi:protein disulfide-isomerase
MKKLAVLAGVLALVGAFLYALPSPAAGGTVVAKTARDGAAAGIDWFEGTVDEAFESAARAKMPVFLYWGAEWCPPCHAINNTVFKSSAFRARARLFIPVYLDGDTPHAQAAGERFGVLGYPTMIVLSAAGEELTRIPGGIDMQAYANVLDLALANTTSVSSRVDVLMKGQEKLGPDACSQLAWYSWGQDPRILAGHVASDVFRRMYDACPGTMAAERSILYLYWLDASLSTLAETDTEGGGRLPQATRVEAADVLNRLLANPALVRANLLTLLSQGARFTAALTGAGSPERAQLARRFLAAYDDIYADASVYKRERLYTLSGRIDFERIDDNGVALSPALEKAIREAVAWADTSTPDPYERQPVINAAANVLEDAGMDELAKSVLLKEIAISGQAYYFMPSLADIERRAGNDSAALEWLRKGWETSKGPATRFQWGTYYLDGLIEMSPGDAQAITSLTVSLVEELLASGGFYQRPKAQLQRLGARLREWGTAGGTSAAFDALQSDIAEVCSRDTDLRSRETCTSFLEAA